jgi:hypothetical protein
MADLGAYLKRRAALDIRTQAQELTSRERTANG